MSFFFGWHFSDKPRKIRLMLSNWTAGEDLRVTAWSEEEQMGRTYGLGLAAERKVGGL